MVEVDTTSEDVNPNQMALVLTRPGALEVKATPSSLPDTLGEGEVQISMLYSAVQPLDTMMLLGAQGPRPSPSTVLGSDGVGIVERSACERLPQGSKVAFLYRRLGVHCGSWRRELVLSVDDACVVCLPGDLAPQVAAAGLTSAAVALASLRHFEAGQQVIITGAAGACGISLVQLALLRGMRVIAFIRGDERGSWLLEEYGASGQLSVIDCSDPSWLQLTTTLCNGTPEEGGGADGVIDGVGGSQVVEMANELLRPRGTLIIYGATAGPADEGELLAASKRRKLRWLQEGARSLLESEDAEVQLQDSLNLMASNKYRPHCWHLSPWSDAMHCLVPQPAWSEYESQLSHGERVGRILLRFT